MSLKDILNQEVVTTDHSGEIVMEPRSYQLEITENGNNSMMINGSGHINDQSLNKKDINTGVPINQAIPHKETQIKTYSDITSFQKHLKCLQKMDYNESVLQDWNFLNLQELELITIWNNQIKDILEENDTVNEDIFESSSISATTGTKTSGKNNIKPDIVDNSLQLHKGDKTKVNNVKDRDNSVDLLATNSHKGLDNLCDNMDYVNKEWGMYQQYLNRKQGVLEKACDDMISKHLPQVKKALKEREKWELEQSTNRKRKAMHKQSVENEEDEEDGENEEEEEGEEEDDDNDEDENSLMMENESNSGDERSLQITQKTKNKLIPTTTLNGKELLIKPKKNKKSLKNNKRLNGNEISDSLSNKTNVSNLLKRKKLNDSTASLINFSKSKKLSSNGNVNSNIHSSYDSDVDGDIKNESRQTPDIHDLSKYFYGKGKKGKSNSHEDTLNNNGYLDKDEREENDEEGEEGEEEQEDDETQTVNGQPLRRSGRVAVTQEEKNRSVIKRMVSKQQKKASEERKRRFTQCVVSDFDESTKKVEIKITLKQHHMKMYKRHIREKEQTKKKEEKAAAAALAAAEAAKTAAATKASQKSKQGKQSKKTNKDKDELQLQQQDKQDLQSTNGKRGKKGKSTADDNTEDQGPDDLEDEDEDLNEEQTNIEIPPLDTTNNHFDTENLPRYGLKMNAREARAIQRHYDNTFFAIWKDLARKDSNKYSKTLQSMQQVRMQNTRKTASLVAREAKKWQMKNMRQMRDVQVRARRGIREMSSYWKRNERDEKELKKKREKELLERAKKEEEEKEKQRQAKQLEFLLTKSEMVSHFIAKKVKTSEHEKAHNSATNLTELANTPHDGDEERPNIELDLTGEIQAETQLHEIDFDNENQEMLDKRAMENASNILKKQQRSVQTYDYNEDAQDELNFQNPSTLGDSTLEQPKILACTLKEYQLNGLRWLNSIYSMGMNGILADEMGLGKTVQSISMLANLAENHNIWGPFIVVTPASTLHNWVQEISKFVPDFKILPYWGNANDRKILRRFWDRKHLRYNKDSPFHIMVTSYQMIVSDAAYLQKMKWQYMILDEAQAIKSAQSQRWKTLLSFHCRNRLLLTGTPIQNNMEELWALLHFIMPDYFNSIDDFNTWFNKDSKDGNMNGMNTDHLNRLHDILKPFMLRRIKKNVQSELGDKIEIDVMCDLTQRQKKLYNSLRSKMSSNYEEIERAAIGGAAIADEENNNTSNGSKNGGSSSTSDTKLINAVMEFRKVCNHPDLFERADVNSPFLFGTFGNLNSFLNDKDNLDLMYSSKNIISVNVPRLIYDEMILPNFENNHIDIKDHILQEKFNIFNSTFENVKYWSFLCLLSGFENPNELKKMSQAQLLQRVLSLFKNPKEVVARVEFLSGLQKQEFSKNTSNLLVPTKNDMLSYAQNIEPDSIVGNLLNVRKSYYNEHYTNNLKPAFSVVAAAPPIVPNVFNTKSLANTLDNVLFDDKLTQALSTIPASIQNDLVVNKNVKIEELPKSEMWPEPLNRNFSTRHISMPSMDRFITDSAKLKKLDQLLVKLKEEDHRVLVYFQMTKMMDLMEDYLTYRQYKHIRLDGSSKLEDRRDLVHDWQTKPEIFVFLLSTRAGGLGINLTAADTVIFYDSDWNPTIDSQAMDRAHRLGQKKQVTVYRLLCRDTIEERMRDTAIKKEQVQKVVMEGKKKNKKIQDAVQVANAGEKQISQPIHESS